jgi:hypothetical protein
MKQTATFIETIDGDRTPEPANGSQLPLSWGS